MQFQGKDLAQFAHQIKFAKAHFEQKPFVPQRSYQNIIICGLGGSGISGRLVANLVQNTLPTPIAVVSDYHLPAYASKDSLIICCSYSGNTEETLSCFKEVLPLQADCIVLCGGGTLAELAAQNQFLHYPAETGYQPRMALGYPLTYLLLIADALAGNQHFAQQLQAELPALENHNQFVEQARELVAEYISLLGEPIEIIADGPNYMTAVRFQQQLNENPKISAFVHPMPEMCHNVIETFTRQSGHYYILLNSETNPRNTMRFSFIENLLKEKGNAVAHYRFNASSLPELLKWNYIFDWYSLVCADKLDVVSSNIPNIIALKETLSKA